MGLDRHAPSSCFDWVVLHQWLLASWRTIAFCNGRALTNDYMLITPSYSEFLNNELRDKATGGEGCYSALSIHLLAARALARPARQDAALWQRKGEHHANYYASLESTTQRNLHRL